MYNKLRREERLWYTLWRNTELHQRNTFAKSTEMNRAAVSESERNGVQIWSIAALVRSGKESEADD